MEILLRSLDCNLHRLVEVTTTCARLAVLGVRLEVEVGQLFEELRKCELACGVVQWPTVKSYQSILVVEGGLLSADTAHLVKLVQRDVELSLESGLDVSPRSCEWA